LPPQELLIFVFAGLTINLHQSTLNAIDGLRTRVERPMYNLQLQGQI
jgi:hypothetical protein